MFAPGKVGLRLRYIKRKRISRSSKRHGFKGGTPRRTDSQTG